MATNDFEATPTEFNIAFNGSLTQARKYGVNVNNEANRLFLIHQSEVIAQRDAEIRWLYHNLHHKTFGEKHDYENIKNLGSREKERA